MYTTKQTRSDDRKAGAATLNLVRDDRGVALIVTMVILISLGLLGTIAVQSSVKETQLATSDKRYKDAFYGADGASELASELLEQNIETVTGFTDSTIGGNIKLIEKRFWMNPESEATTPSDENRDFYLAGVSATSPRTNIKLGGRPTNTPGGAIQMAAGYEGRGKSASQGGTNLIYTINVQHIGRHDSESVVRIEWRHVN